MSPEVLCTVACRLGVFHVCPRDCAILILLSGYVKAPPGGVLLVACILGTDSNYGNMTSPMKVHLSASERSARNQLHLLEKASFLVLLEMIPFAV